MYNRPAFSYFPLVLIATSLFLFEGIAMAQPHKKKSVQKTTNVKVKEEPIQIVSFELLENGDTVNKLDNKKVQHGKWVIENPPHYEEPGNIEVGTFDNGVRVGKWRTYSMLGVIESEEFYKFGLKDGEARYYEDGYLICVANYLALNQTKMYDTVLVEDPVTNEFKSVRIKTETGSVRHGMWTFYDGRSKRIKRVIEYQGDEIVYDKSYNPMSKTDSVYVMRKIKALPHNSNKQDENIWMSKGGAKQRIKYTDLPDNAPYIKPNVRKK